MKYSTTFIIIAITVFLMIPAQAADKQAAEKIISHARDMLEKSVALHGGWQSTKKLIANAELSLTKGKYEQAEQMAKRAIREARLSFQQAQRESKTWTEPDFLKK